MSDKEYRLKISVRNNKFIEKIEEAGFKNVAEFCRVYNLKQNTLNSIIGMKCPPLDQMGRFRPIIIEVCEILGCVPEDLFTENQLNIKLRHSSYIAKVGEADMKHMIETNNATKSIEYMVQQEEDLQELDIVLDHTLSERERFIIDMRFGLGKFNKEHTFEEITKAWSQKCKDDHIKEYGTEEGYHDYTVVPGRINQIEKNALRKLRHPRNNKDGVLSKMIIDLEQIQ